MIVTLKERDVHTGNLILVNQDYAYQDTYLENQEEAGLVCIPDSDVRLKQCAAGQLACLLRDIHAEHAIVPVSGWRPRREQQQIWEDSIADHGLAFTRTYVAVPGHSEHQTGLAIDLGKMQEAIDFLCPDFPYEGICQTFRERAAAYGFVERYPKGREEVTGIGHEPWHFRYVGAPHAQIMSEQGMALEEYVRFLRQFPHGRRAYRMAWRGYVADLSFVKMDPGQDEKDMQLELDGRLAYGISGNNADGFVITEWRHGYA